MILVCKFLVLPLPSQFFALLGFVVSAVLISAAASEVVSLLHMLGVVLRLSNTVLGLTLLAWGNSIGGNALKTSFSIFLQKHTICNFSCLKKKIVSYFQTAFLTSPSLGRVTHGWLYLPALEASFSVSLFLWLSVKQHLSCMYKRGF